MKRRRAAALTPVAATRVALAACCVRGACVLALIFGAVLVQSALAAQVWASALGGGCRRRDAAFRAGLFHRPAARIHCVRVDYGES